MMHTFLIVFIAFLDKYLGHLITGEHIIHNTNDYGIGQNDYENIGKFSIWNRLNKYLERTEQKIIKKIPKYFESISNNIFWQSIYEK